MENYPRTKSKKRKRMKLNLIIPAILLFLAANINAQEIKPHRKTMSMGPHAGYFVDLEMAEKKNVEKLWKNYLKDYSKKVKKNKNEFYTEEGRIPLINGSAELTLYSMLDEGRNVTTLYTWVDLGGGVFMNEEDHVTQSEGMKQFLSDFYLIVRKDVIKRELEEEEKRLEKLSKELSKLQDKNEDYHNEITKAQEKIRKAEENIEKNLNLQNDKEVEILKQQKKIEKIIEHFNKVGKAT